MTDEISEFIGRDVVQAAEYVVAWWVLHPAEEAAFNDLELPEAHAYRAQLYDKINEATEGDLEKQVTRGAEWTIAFGLACSGVLKK